MNCPDCGGENKESDRTCKSCGKELPGTLPAGVFLNQNVPAPGNGISTNFPLQTLAYKEVFKGLNKLEGWVKFIIAVVILISLTAILGFIILFLSQR